MAIFETSEHKPEAEKFVDFLLSDKGQELVQRQGYIPASESVAMPEGFPSRDEIVLMSFDAAKALENTDINKKKFAQIFDAE
ncbi:ABC transporter substrate binding protein [Vibrio variabilis]|uniref:ABC transporter substrate binding protein n=1 Tax=Vibrio variabilis TaxID=990271 RepID=A0ABQ0JHI1_9VIBR|nr:ABC transporter substrate binding protein [Vibrio variabilis]